MSIAALSFKPFNRSAMRDFFGILDVIALDPESGVVGTQSCGSSFAKRWRKLTEDRAHATHDSLSTPGTSLELWGWFKVKKNVVGGPWSGNQEPRLSRLRISSKRRRVAEDGR